MKDKIVHGLIETFFTGVALFVVILFTSMMLMLASLLAGFMQA
jgi:hypothetical protein